MPIKAWEAALLCAALFVAAPVPAASPGGDPAALKIDQDLQGLKDETIRLNRDLEGLEQGTLYPDQSMTTIYVAVKVGGFLIDDISVRINENEAVTHTYSDSEALALLKDDGWQRLLRLPLEPGTYRLQAQFTGHFFDAKPSDPPTRGKVETLFEKGLTELDLVLPVSRNTRLDKPGLSEISRIETRKVRPSRNVWLPQPQRFESTLAEGSAGTLNDPRYRAALFLKNDGRYLSALTELLQIEQGASDPATLPATFRLLEADCYVGFGMQAQAERVYQQIAVGDSDPLTAARAQITLASFEYQRGYLPQAIERLNRIRPKLPSSLLDDWRLQMTGSLLAQDRYNEAITMLTDKDGAVDDDLPPVLRYNLAVALIRDGRAAEGRRQLNQVGTMDVTTLDMLVLRDKANLTLGYQYLQGQEGKNAKTVFGRIRTNGPFSNRALLGIGWSEIAPPEAPKAGDLTAEAEGKNTADSLGTLLRPGYVDPNARARVPVENKPIAGLSPEEQQGLLRALVPWAELVKRDPMDPAVQEGMLAIPWALDRLLAFEESLARYTDAIASLETARKRMDEAMKSIKGGRMVSTIVRRDIDSERGWLWRLRDLPDAPETYFLQSVLAENRFQEALKNYRDARLLARNIDSWKERLDKLQAGAAAGAATIEHQLQHARQGWHPTWEGTVVWLGLETSLGAPGEYDAPLRDAPEAPLGLATLAPPGAFEGVAERLKPARAHLDALRPRVSAAGTAEDDLLETISIKELAGQKGVIEQYLTQARFAVARIYDRQLQMKGGQ
jgi:tetratricopeptide (TPR) repeat protein